MKISDSCEGTEGEGETRSIVEGIVCDKAESIVTFVSERERDVRGGRWGRGESEAASLDDSWDESGREGVEDGWRFVR